MLCPLIAVLNSGRAGMQSRYQHDVLTEAGVPRTKRPNLQQFRPDLTVAFADRVLSLLFVAFVFWRMAPSAYFAHESEWGGTDL